MYIIHVVHLPEGWCYFFKMKWFDYCSCKCFVLIFFFFGVNDERFVLLLGESAGLDDHPVDAAVQPGSLRQQEL